MGALNSALPEQSESHAAVTHWTPSTIALVHPVIVDDYLSTDYASGEVKYHRTCIVQTVLDIRSRSLARERRVSKIA